MKYFIKTFGCQMNPPNLAVRLQALFIHGSRRDFRRASEADSEGLNKNGIMLLYLYRFSNG